MDKPPRRAYSCLVCGKDHSLFSKIGQAHLEEHELLLNLPREPQSTLSDEEVRQRLFNAIFGDEAKR